MGSETVLEENCLFSSRNMMSEKILSITHNKKYKMGKYFKNEEKSVGNDPVQEASIYHDQFCYVRQWNITSRKRMA